MATATRKRKAKKPPASERPGLKGLLDEREARAQAAYDAIGPETLDAWYRAQCERYVGDLGRYGGRIHKAKRDMIGKPKDHPWWPKFHALQAKRDWAEKVSRILGQLGTIPGPDGRWGPTRTVITEDRLPLVCPRHGPLGIEVDGDFDWEGVAAIGALYEGLAANHYEMRCEQCQG